MSTSLMILFRIMSTRILVLAFLLYYISFSSTFALSIDGPSLFSEDIDPLQNTNFVDITTPDLVLDQNLNGGDPNGFDLFFNDPGSDLFASGDLDAASSNSIDDTILLADCSSTNGAYSGKKARARRGAVCPEPASGSNPTLSLPTLDQLGPLQATKDPFRPKTDREAEIQAAVNRAIPFIRVSLPFADFLMNTCDRDIKVCSSDNQNDIHLDTDGVTYTLTDATSSELSSSQNRALQKSFYSRHGSC